MSGERKPNCGKCGLCLSVCPVYQVMKEEQASPRARLHLIKAHDRQALKTSPYLQTIMSQCLMCGSCAAICPSGINHYAEFMAMRGKMAADHGEDPAVKSLIYLLAREYRTRLGAGLARVGQKILPESLSDKFKLGPIPVSRFPAFNPVPFRRAHDTVIRPPDRIIGRVVYFTGCATNYLYADTGEAVIGILRHLGYKIIIPGKQTCCSIPLLFHGAEEAAMSNIRTNIRAMGDILANEQADAIIVDCSTCGEALKNEYPKILRNDGDHLSKALDIASRVEDILSFVHARIDRLAFRSDISEIRSVTYHAPCHTRNTFQSHPLVEDILGNLPSVNYKRTPDFDQCCGGGGTFFYEFPEISKKMVDKKIECAKSVQVTDWLTDCPVCRLNLAGNLKPTDGLRVLHPVSLIHSVLKQS